MSSLYSEPMDTESWEERQKKREQALQERLKKLPKNDLVKGIMSEKADREKENKKYDEFEIIHRLVGQAREMFVEKNEDFSTVAKNLGESISALAKKA